MPMPKTTTTRDHRRSKLKKPPRRYRPEEGLDSLLRAPDLDSVEEQEKTLARRTARKTIAKIFTLYPSDVIRLRQLCRNERGVESLMIRHLIREASIPTDLDLQQIILLGKMAADAEKFYRVTKLGGDD